MEERTTRPAASGAPADRTIFAQNLVGKAAVIQLQAGWKGKPAMDALATTTLRVGYNGKSTRIFTRRMNSGPVILFVHGWMQSSEIWLDVMKRIKPSYELLAIDLPGFGQSPPLEPGSETIENYAAVLLDIIEQIRSGQQLLMIVGDSLGAIVVLGALAAKQLPTKQITLSGCPGRGLPRWVCALTMRKLLTSSLATLQKLPVSLSRRIIYATTAATFKNRAKVHDAVQRAVQRSDPRTAEILLRLLCQREQNLIDCHSVAAKNSQAHFLILRGEYDRLVSRESSRVLARALNGRVEEIKGVGHTTMLEDPAGYAKAILAADLRADLPSASERSWG